jgi:PKD repeat protein/pimeloyl-ACP methyl ester carboxylesterase
MKQFYLIVILVLASFNAIALPDLIVTTGNFSPASIEKGGLLSVSVTVKNQGNQTADQSYLLFFLMKTPTFGQNQILSRTSVKTLAPNESVTVNFYYCIPTSDTIVGSYFLGFRCDEYNDIQENNEANDFYLQASKISVQNTTLLDNRLTYPIIFVHGYTDNANNCWDKLTDELDAFYGFVYGGKMNFCLNNDASLSRAIMPNDYKDFTALNNRSNLSKGDYYYVNFDVNPEGTSPTRSTIISNQSAIFKQGKAVSDAIRHVLAVTGQQKVILVGHSMGGLASREYLQNSNNWQSDGEHHVAKLLTIATPHGGSDFGSLINLGILAGKDERSEAARDFRYPNLFYRGAYLYGGYERTYSGIYSYNDDNNCNGAEGDPIEGLNYQPFYNNLAYSCIIGRNGSAGGDNFVSDFRADITQIRGREPVSTGVVSDRFWVEPSELGLASSSKDFHSNLTHLTPRIMAGLDEPYNSSLAYYIEPQGLYFGFITTQDNTNTNNANAPADWDAYKILLNANGSLRVIIGDIPVPAFAFSLLNSNGQSVATVQAIGRSNIDTTITNLSQGRYTLYIGGNPTANSWRFPYVFQTVLTATSTPLLAQFSTTVPAIGCSPLSVTFNDLSLGSPTSWQWSFPGGNPSTSTLKNPVVTYSLQGQYNVTLTAKNASGNSQTITQQNFVTVQVRPYADFSFVTTGNTATFQNNSVNITNARYLWEFGDSTVSNQFAPSHVYTQAGTYPIKLTVTNNCGTSVFSKSVTIRTTGINEVDNSFKVRILPNPTNGKFTLQLSEVLNTEGVIEVVNSIGEIVYSEKTPTLMDTKYDLSLSNFANGIYFLKIRLGDKTAIEKLIIQK